MNLIDFLTNQLGDLIYSSPLVAAVTIAILFGVFFEFYHIISSILFSFFRR